MRHVFKVIATTNTPVIKMKNAFAPEECVQSIQTDWAEALRSDCGRTRDTLLCQLSETTQELAAKHPNDAKVLLWNGVVLTGYAKSLGGLCALKLLEAAKASLERSIALAPHDGAGYLYLGLLYENAPEAPYSFGDEQMAKTLLEQGLSLTLHTQVPRMKNVAMH